MAIHDVGYRAWDGALTSPWTRWMVISYAGIRRAWQSTWLKRLMLVAWIPVVWFSFGFFIWEHSLHEPEVREVLEAFLMQPSQLPGISGDLSVQDEVVGRHSVWSWLLLTFLRYPQSVVVALMVGIIAPPLVSQDVRSRAFLQYFSRPIARWQYALGKLSTVWFYLTAISAAPALLMYLLGVLLSPSLAVVIDTWDLPLRILAAAGVLMVPTAALALCLSSFTQESRYAAFAWFALWVLGSFTYGVMFVVEVEHARDVPVELWSKWAPLSLYHCLGIVQSWVFGFTTFQQAKICCFTLVGLTCVATALFFRRISAPLRA